MSLKPGASIPTLVKKPTSVAMFRFSAVMWNAHRTHIDHPYATEVEGHKSTLAQDYLLATYLSEMLIKWGGPHSRVTRLSYRNRGPVYANSTVKCWGRITSFEKTDQASRVDLEVGIDDENGHTCVPGKATIEILDVDGARALQ
jgi:hydroxyacyl-ACP dehydratase HTD2-like protein with hotdog domain